MYKLITKSLLIALAISTTPLVQASAPAAQNPANGNSWTWTTYITAGLAVVTPLLAYQCLKSYKSQPTAKERDNQADALYSRVTAAVANKKAITDADRDEMISIAKADDRLISETAVGAEVARYNFADKTTSYFSSRLIEIDIENCLARRNISGRINTKFRHWDQKFATAAYGTLAGLTGLTAAGLYFSKK